MCEREREGDRETMVYRGLLFFHMKRLDFVNLPVWTPGSSQRITGQVVQASVEFCIKKRFYPSLPKEIQCLFINQFQNETEDS